jgi:hypothetical protein
MAKSGPDRLSLWSIRASRARSTLAADAARASLAAASRRSRPAQPPGTPRLRRARRRAGRGRRGRDADRRRRRLGRVSAWLSRRDRGEHHGRCPRSRLRHRRPARLRRRPRCGPTAGCRATRSLPRARPRVRHPLTPRDMELHSNGPCTVRARESSGGRLARRRRQLAKQPPTGHVDRHGLDPSLVVAHQAAPGTEVHQPAAQVLVVGIEPQQSVRTNTALIVLDPEASTASANGHGIPDSSAAGLAENADVQAEVAAAIERADARVNRVEHIKKFRIAPVDCLSSGDELTPRSSFAAGRSRRSTPPKSRRCTHFC